MTQRRFAWLWSTHHKRRGDHGRALIVTAALSATQGRLGEGDALQANRVPAAGVFVVHVAPHRLSDVQPGVSDAESDRYTVERARTWSHTM